MKIYDEDDANIRLVAGKKVAVIGYGSQGRGHVLNLRDSGVQDLIVALKEGSVTAKKCAADDIEVRSVAEATAWADFIVVLAPDEVQKDIYKDHIEPYLSAGKTLAFAHGLTVHFGLIEPRDDVDVVLIAPKGPGHQLRALYEAGKGLPSLIAVHQNATGKATDLALSYAAALGSGRAGIMETTFREECETDLFGEQAVLCGGVVDLIRAGFETLTEAGYAKEMAYIETLHEVKLIVDLIYEGGISNMNYSISNTAEYGGYKTGPRLVTDETRAEMKRVLKDVQEGKFVRDWMLECQAGQPNFHAKRQIDAEHPIEEVGKRLRERMPMLIQGKKLVDRERH